MKGKNEIHSYCFYFFLVMLLFIFLSACGGITPTIPVINSFSASPPTTTSGDSSILSWSITDATSATIDQGVGSVAVTTGTTSVSPIVTTTYTLTATNSAGSVTATTTVTVEEQQEPADGYGVISVNSDPSGAKIYLDEVDTGEVTPAILTNIESGSHTILLTKYIYKNWVEEFSLDPGESLVLNITMIHIGSEDIESMVIILSNTNGKDAGVETANPNTNYGSLDFFAVGKSAAPNTARAYLKFDLNELPDNAVIMDYDNDLKLYVYDYWGSGNFNIYVHQVLESWQEDEITWNNKPDFSSNPIELNINSSSYLNTFVRIADISDYLQGDWKNSNVYKYGVVLIGGEDVIAPLFYSSEYSESNKRPKLNIKYYIP